MSLYMIQRSNNVFLEMKLYYSLENDWNEGPEEGKCMGINRPSFLPLFSVIKLFKLSVRRTIARPEICTYVRLFFFLLFS